MASLPSCSLLLVTLLHAQSPATPLHVQLRSRQAEVEQRVRRAAGVVTTELEADTRHIECSTHVSNQFRDLSEARYPNGVQHSALNVAPRLDDLGKAFIKQVRSLHGQSRGLGSVFLQICKPATEHPCGDAWH